MIVGLIALSLISGCVAWVASNVSGIGNAWVMMLITCNSVPVLWVLLSHFGPKISVLQHKPRSFSENI